MATATTMEVSPRRLLSIWDSLTPSEREKFVELNPKAAPLVDSLQWMFHATKTRDDQCPDDPYKTFPQYPYFQKLHELWLGEPVLFIKKSRTMLISWWAAGESLHWTMTHQPAVCLYWAPDEDRALKLIDYAWELYTNQWDSIKEQFPLDRPRDRQAYNSMEFAAGGKVLALPGKDPQKIRSEHPSLLIMDEVTLMENWAEAWDVAMASKVPKAMCIGTGYPSSFSDFTREAIRLAR